MAAEGLANAEIARRCEVDADAVRRWRKRFEQEGPVDGSTHGSTQTMAARVGIGKNAVARLWAEPSPRCR